MSWSGALTQVRGLPFSGPICRRPIRNAMPPSLAPTIIVATRMRGGSAVDDDEAIFDDLMQRLMIFLDG